MDAAEPPSRPPSSEERQFVAPTGVGTTHFEEILQTLEVKLRIASRAQTKGQEERITQFIQRDFLATEEWRKVAREATVRYRNRHFRVPEDYIGWHV